MATSKTLTPTNVSISIPAFTDAPDQRVNSDCIDKEADAINALQTNKFEKSNIKNNLTTTSSGYALDARQGKALNDKITTIGTVVSAEKTGQTINANGSTAYAENSITLAAGTWMIFGSCSISNSVSGSRQGFTIATSNSAGSYNTDMYTLTNQNSTSGNNQYHNVSGLVQPSASTTYYAMIYNGNVSASVSTWLKAVRIK